MRTVLIIDDVLMNLVSWLRKAGVEGVVVRQAPAGSARIGALLEIGPAKFNVYGPLRRAPYPNELPKLAARHMALRLYGHPLFLAPFISESVGARLVDADWSWADEHGNFDIRSPGLLLRQRLVVVAPRVTTKGRLPRGSGGLAVVRALVRFGGDSDEVSGVTALARRAGVSQPRTSQVLSRLADVGLVVRQARGRWTPDREALLDAFLDEYAGPGGYEQHLYSLDPLTDVAADWALRLEGRLVVSADVGPDLVAPWRRPTLLIVYAQSGVEPLGLTEAQGRDDANVVLRFPLDVSVFPSSPLTAELTGRAVPLVDPMQMIWDLHQLGGADRIEAAEVIRQWLIAPR